MEVFGIPGVNESGEMLIELCSEKDFLERSTHFFKRRKVKETYRLFTHHQSIER